MALALASIWWTGCAHRVTVREGRIYDFARPPDCPGRFGPPPEDPVGEQVVTLRYLGAGGLAIRWGNAWVLTAPFFSNPDLLRVSLGRLSPDREAIEDGLRGVPAGAVSAILVGHSHYDHLGDLPFVARHLTPRALVFVNRSGAQALRAVPALAHRVRVLEEGAERDWVRLSAADGTPLPFRLRAVPTGHAPHFLDYTWAGGEVTSPWRGPWRRHHNRGLRAGTPFAFVLELLSSDLRPVGRLFLQDSAGNESLDRVPAGTYELAVLCMASAHKVPPYPKDVLAVVQPRHALVIHYESFFREASKPIRFVPLLTRRRADHFLDGTVAAMGRQGRVRGPRDGSCGPSTPQWTMPLPGEWLQIRISD